MRLKGLATSHPSSLQPWALRVLPQVCVARQHDLPERPPSNPQELNKRPRLGIVAVLCDESLAPFLGLGCDAGDPEVVLHLYSKCGVTRDQALEKLGHMAPCVATFREVEPTLETDLSWPKHHRDYLEHIIAKCVPSPASLPFVLSLLLPWLHHPYRAPGLHFAPARPAAPLLRPPSLPRGHFRSYDTLQPSMMFLKGNFLRRRLQLDDMVQDMLEQEWAFKSYGLPKVSTVLLAAAKLCL